MKDNNGIEMGEVAAFSAINKGVASMALETHEKSEKVYRAAGKLPTLVKHSASDAQPTFTIALGAKRTEPMCLADIVALQVLISAALNELE